ncbi:unnamed protein product [Mytilus coruscus]|uniref:Endonuclease/exonuclease/phosphatase domain-containing protein n=1 Tax=Mytilus coruscus TaxID=42192 RepID=A0A6J8B8J3_MYTCO|nr:unnamed protein product [Mytilus coruscus]
MQTPDNTNRLRRLSKPSPPENESVKRYIMSSQSDPDSPPVDIDPSVIHHATVSAGLSSLQYQQVQEPNIQSQTITCSLAESDIIKIALQLKELLHDEIDYTIKATIQQYKFEIDKLSKENQSLRDDIDALEQYGRRDLLRINGIPDGGSSETSEQTTELVIEFLKSDTNDVVRSHRIGQPRTGSVNAIGARNSVPPRPRQVIVKLKDHFAKKRILKCKKAMRENRDLRYIRVNEDLTKIRNTIAFKARQLRIEHHIRDTWTVNGKIFVKDNIEQPFRRDRGPQKTGGGVVVYVKNNLVAHRRQEIEMDNLESVWLELKLHGKKSSLWDFLYPPNCEQDIWVKLENSLDMALNDNHVDYIMITGDFNDNQINCANSKIRPLLTQFSLNQLIDEPTHFTEQSSSLLDLFMTNNVNAVTYCGVGPPLLEQLSSILPVIPFNASTTINEIELNETEVEDILSIINPSKASGPDLINPKLLKEASAILKSPLCKLFNLSLRSAVFPHQWKRANVSLYSKVEVGRIRLNVGRIHYPSSDSASNESVLYGVIGCILVASIVCVLLVIFIMRRSMNKKMDKARTELKEIKEEMRRIVATEGLPERRAYMRRRDVEITHVELSEVDNNDVIVDEALESDTRNYNYEHLGQRSSNNPYSHLQQGSAEYQLQDMTGLDNRKHRDDLRTLGFFGG